MAEPFKYSQIALNKALLLLFLFAGSSLYGQRKFDTASVEKALLNFPEKVTINPDSNVLRAIEAVDRKYRLIVDTLYSFASYKHTILQTIYIEIDDSTTINPLNIYYDLKISNIIFYHDYLNPTLNSLASRLPRNERKKLYAYLADNYQDFSTQKKKLRPQPVSIKYIKFSENRYAKVGIDIYGQHFLWTIDKRKDWDVIKVETLWIY